MTDPTGLPSALGIEAVEWFAEGESLTVWVTGRWRRRRPTWGGQPVLVIEAGETRHRFPAMPEPPSVTGAAPGTWRMSFAVPASLAPHLSRRAWLRLGAVVLPLPIDTEPTGGLEREAQEPAPVPEPAEAQAPAVPRPAPDSLTLAERQLRGAEVALEAARSRAAEAEDAASELRTRIEQLERELTEARNEPTRLSDLLAERDRSLRFAEQRAYAERALREELEERVAEGARQLNDTAGVLRELAGVQERVVELEEELEYARRRADESEQVAVSARAAQERAESAAAEASLRGEVRRLGSIGTGTASGLDAELAIARRLAPAQRPGGANLPPQVRLPALELERAMANSHSARAEQLERELTDQVKRSRTAYEAIERLRGELEVVRLAYQGLREPGGGPIDPGRLSAALARLREGTAIEEESVAQPERAPSTAAADNHAVPVRPWFAPVFRALTREDPTTAGRLLVRLLPAQRLVTQEPIAFDLVLQGLGCIQVSSDRDRTVVTTANARRLSSETQFRVIGELPSLARLLVAGRIRRHLGHGIARVRGDRRLLGALIALIQTPLSLRDLRSAGVRLEPGLALSILSLMVEPAWTRGRQFTIAYQELGASSPGIYFQVRDGGRPTVTESPPVEPVTTTIVGPSELFLALLDGEQAPDLEIRGERGPLALAQEWVKRAQSG